MGIRHYVKKKIETLRATFELINDRINKKQEMYEERFGDPEETEVKDILQEIGGDNDGE